MERRLVIPVRTTLPSEALLVVSTNEGTTAVETSTEFHVTALNFASWSGGDRCAERGDAWWCWDGGWVAGSGQKQKRKTIQSPLNYTKNT